MTNSWCLTHMQWLNIIKETWAIEKEILDHINVRGEKKAVLHYGLNIYSLLLFALQLNYICDVIFHYLTKWRSKLKPVISGKWLLMCWLFIFRLLFHFIGWTWEDFSSILPSLDRQRTPWSCGPQSCCAPETTWSSVNKPKLLNQPAVLNSKFWCFSENCLQIFKASGGGCGGGWGHVKQKCSLASCMCAGVSRLRKRHRGAPFLTLLTVFCHFVWIFAADDYHDHPVGELHATYIF